MILEIIIGGGLFVVGYAVKSVYQSRKERKLLDMSTKSVIDEICKDIENGIGHYRVENFCLKGDNGLSYGLDQKDYDRIMLSFIKWNRVKEAEEYLSKEEERQYQPQKLLEKNTSDLSLSSHKDNIEEWLSKISSPPPKKKVKVRKVKKVSGFKKGI